MAEELMIHIVDLGSGDATFWVPLLQSFSRLPNGAPFLRITSVNRDKIALEKLRQKLVKEAESLSMPFQFNPVNVKFSDLKTEMIEVRTGESLALISVLSLHELLAEDDRVDAHFGGGRNAQLTAVKECRQMSQFLSAIRSMEPKVFFLVEQEADHNQTRLVDRFVESLHYYSEVFDSIDANFGALCGGDEERVNLEDIFGREIENIVACEGAEREGRGGEGMGWVRDGLG